MRIDDLASLLRGGVLDSRTAALIWLLVEGGVPVVVAGPASADSRRAVAASLLAVDPSTEWTLIDADAEPLTTERLAALLRGGVALGISLDAADLAQALDRFVGMGLPEDGVRRLGVVVILDQTEAGLRCTSVHYLRPSERDARGHVQRRPPAILAAWDDSIGAAEDFAWGITPELADRVDRSQADLEERRAARARFLDRVLLHGEEDAPAGHIAAFLAAEPERVPAPAHETRQPSPFQGGLLDADGHDH